MTARRSHLAAALAAMGFFTLVCPPRARAQQPTPPASAPFAPLAPRPLTADQPEAPPIDQPPSYSVHGAAAPVPLTPVPLTPAPEAAAQPTPPPNVGPGMIDIRIPNPSRFTDPGGDPDHLAQHLLVVYNRLDPDSRALAFYYAKRRHIADDHILALACPLREEITREEYERTIHRPVVDALLRHHWLERKPHTITLNGHVTPILAATHNDIWAIVLIRGMPLKIAAAPLTGPAMQSVPEMQTSAAAVDSELALLPLEGLPLGGFVPNPFYDSANAGEVRVGPELATLLVLVTRLDGPTPANVRRMIDDCLAAEKDRLAGQAVVDTRGITDPANPYILGDRWLRASRDILAEEGWSVLFDNNPDTLPRTLPISQVALYLGWYTPDADGPWVTPPGRFVPGAIAYHLHSFSAVTLRSTTRNWVGPLIDHGADATMGCVYEPYLALTPHIDIFTRRLLDGNSFAEAAYACQIGLSWMITVVGDPLYHPFQKPLDEALAGTAPGPHRDWLLLQQIGRQLNNHPPATAAALEAAFNIPGGGAVLSEHLGDLLQKLNDPAAPGDAEKAYLTAAKESAAPIDCIRIGEKLARLETAENQIARAQAELRALANDYPIDAERFGVSPQAIPVWRHPPGGSAGQDTSVAP